MNSQSDTSQQFPPDSQAVAPAPMSEPRPMYWSVRRELWENRSIYVAPLLVTAVVLFASLISTVWLPRMMRALPTLDAAKRHAAVVNHYSMAPALIMMTALIVGIFYCLDALHGERRDRSILFWKSMPVSDRTTVLSKAAIPLAVLPLIAFVLSLAAFVGILFLSTAVLLMNGMSPSPLWTELRFFQQPVVMFYGLTVHALWFAPIYGWLLMISAWARRATFLWAVLPLLAVAAVEKIAFNTTLFLSLLKYRIVGAMSQAFDVGPNHGANGIIDQLTQLDPVKFLGTPGLWIGLLVAAAFLAVAVRLRRYREPI
jgi:ABC-2 type transport system permease protein